ncbi:MAG: hypothetical protein NZM27_05595 [Acetobacteraceae bacterium]|nr:hypothetical protein [Acetobacteraceae bacterium]MDW8399562.1 hypothetical protein [Acetobacteraceae bacterium]
MEHALGGIAIVALALHLGAAAFFSAALAPAAFGALAPEGALRALGLVVRPYYLFLFGTAGAAALALFRLSPVDGGLMALSAGASLWLLGVLLPRLRGAYAALAAGEAAGGREAKRLRRLAEAANLFQLLLALALLLRFVP